MLLIFAYPQNMIFIVFSLYVLTGLISLAWRFYPAQRAKRTAKLYGRRRTICAGADGRLNDLKGADHGQKRIVIFDTTLRDGEQAPGCSLGPAQKLQVAEQLVPAGR